jgi:putative ABC transport system permease protein
MLKTYLKNSVREIYKNRLFSTIHIIGLSTGIAAFVIILQYALYELSYDRFYRNPEQIYRIRQDRYNKGVLSTTWGGGCAAIGPAVKREFPEVVDFARLTGVKGTISTGDKFFREEKMFASNTSFLTMMPVKLLSGDDSTALNEPFTAVVSESVAKKYYGNTDVIGQTFKLDNEVVFKITGVFPDPPQNTHFKFNILLSWATIIKFTGEKIETAWNWDGYYTYIRLVKGTDPDVFQKKMNELALRETGELMKQYNQSAEYILQPLTSIHLHSHLMTELEVNGNAYTVYFLIVIAFIILIVAWVNYINLSTVKAVFRSREIAVRKISGGSKMQIIAQFLAEAFVINLIASLLAVLLIAVTMPFFRIFTARELYLSNPQIWIILISVILFGPVLSGLYPALLTSSFKPMSVFRGGQTEGGNSSAFIRKALIVFQFAVSVVLVACTFTVFRQIKFMKNQELGVNIDRTIVLRGPGVVDSTYADKLTGFKAELLKNSLIKTVTSSTCVPGSRVPWNAGGVKRVTDDDSKGNQYRILGIDYDFVDSYGLSVIAGRNFSRDYGSDEKSVLFNEAAVKLMGFESPEKAVGESIAFWGNEYKIAGVLKNYHHESLKENFDALIFRLIPGTRDFFSVKLDFAGLSGDDNSVVTGNAVRMLKDNWGKFFPGNPFEYFILTDHYDKQYDAEAQFMTIFELFAILAITLACLGLFGLSWFVIARRTKEIGIRKVNGASFSEVIRLISVDFFKLIIIGIVIAAPLTYMFSIRWLEKFASKTTFSWGYFLVSGFIILIISAVAIGYNVWLIARTNPAESLREN